MDVQGEKDILPADLFGNIIIKTMNKLLIGKINLSKIDKSKLFKGEKGMWMDIAVWFSEEPDKFGNNLSIQQSTKKDEPKIYLGEAKFYVPKEEKKEPPEAKQEFAKGSDLPF
jgi:hypothetical protein